MPFLVALEADLMIFILILVAKVLSSFLFLVVNLLLFLLVLEATC
jgi:hypothetical protein